jgi:predicted enzyme related to lactoylglutathione lyase
VSEPPVRLDRIGQIRINVHDIDRAVGFYRDVLGMTLLFEVPEQGLAFFDCGGVRLYLGGGESTEGTSTAAIYYSVDGLDDVHRRLVEHGVEFQVEPATVYRLEQVEGRMAFLTDSEGNTVALMEELPL